MWLFPYYYWEGNNWDKLETTDPNYSATEYGSDFVDNAKKVLGEYPGGEYSETPAGTGTAPTVRLFSKRYGSTNAKPR